MNEHTDNRFREIWAKRLLGVIYTGTLLLAFCLLLLFLPDLPAGQGGLPVFAEFKWFVALLGVIGGLASGIISGEREYMAKGHFWNFIFYYSLVRPLMGALAAVVMFVMLQCHFLLAINTVAALDSSPVVKGKGLTSALNPGKAIVELSVAQDKELYAYVLFLFLAGFSGDKLLKSVADRMNSKLFSEAEKTRESMK